MRIGRSLLLAIVVITGSVSPVVAGDILECAFDPDLGVVTITL